MVSSVSNGTNGAHGNSRDVASTDPAVYVSSRLAPIVTISYTDNLERYSEYATRWPSVPIDEAGWIQRAQEVADVFAVDAAVRERENKSPRAEIALLKYAGLLKVLGPQEYGGGGQPWSVAYKMIRKVAEADG
jgi:hypothetical protein